MKRISEELKQEQRKMKRKTNKHSVNTAMLQDDYCLIKSCEETANYVGSENTFAVRTVAVCAAGAGRQAPICATIQFLQVIIIGDMVFVVCGKFVFTFSSVAVTDSVRFEIFTALTVKISYSCDLM